MISDAAALNLHHELDLKRADIEALASRVHSVRDIGACVASGSFQSDGMVIAPCSMKTLASVAHGMCDNLITRAADVMLKERRKLVLMVRETPFNLAHLRNMTAVTEMGGIVFPPLPAFYQKPQSLTEMVDQTVGRVLDLFGIEQSLAPQWQGLKADKPSS
jgi:4-hydroxy-3-polyprenylbenzoate decarboxylase